MPPRLTYEVPQGPQDIANQAWNDPWFALGNLAARYWNKQYDERGIKGVTDSDAAKIPGTQSGAKVTPQTPQETNDQALNQNLTNYLSQGIQPISTQGQAGTPDLTQQASFFSNPSNLMNQGGLNATNDPAMLGILDKIGQQGISMTPDQQKSFLDYANQRQAQQANAVPMSNYMGIQPVLGGNPDQNIQQAVLNTLGGQTANFTAPPAADGGSPNSSADTEPAAAQTETSLTPEEAAYRDSLYAKSNKPLSPQASQELHDAMAARQQGQADQQSQANTIQPFSVEEWKARMQAEGVRQGRPQYQIDEAIARLLPQAQQAEDRYNKALSENYLMDAIQNRPTFGNNGANLDRYQYDIAQLIKLNPGWAQYILSGNPNALDYFRNSTEDYRTNRNMKNAEAMADDDLIRKIKMANVNLANDKERAAFTANLNYGEKIRFWEYMEAHPELFVKTGGAAGGGTKSSKGGVTAGGQVDPAVASAYSGIMNDLLASTQGDADYQQAALDKATAWLASDAAKNIPDEAKDQIKKAQYVVNSIREKKAGYPEKARQYAEALSPDIRAKFGLDELFSRK